MEPSTSPSPDHMVTMIMVAAKKLETISKLCNDASMPEACSIFRTINRGFLGEVRPLGNVESGSDVSAVMYLQDQIINCLHNSFSFDDEGTVQGIAALLACWDTLWSTKDRPQSQAWFITDKEWKLRHKNHKFSHMSSDFIDNCENFIAAENKHGKPLNQTTMNYLDLIVDLLWLLSKIRKTTSMVKSAGVLLETLAVLRKGNSFHAKRIAFAFNRCLSAFIDCVRACYPSIPKVNDLCNAAIEHVTVFTTSEYFADMVVKLGSVGPVQSSVLNLVLKAAPVEGHGVYSSATGPEATAQQISRILRMKCALDAPAEIWEGVCTALSTWSGLLLAEVVLWVRKTNCCPPLLYRNIARVARSMFDSLNSDTRSNVHHRLFESMVIMYNQLASCTEFEPSTWLEACDVMEWLHYRVNGHVHPMQTFSLQASIEALDATNMAAAMTTWTLKDPRRAFFNDYSSRALQCATI